MNATPEFEIFLVVAPGLEAVLAEEARQRGFAGVTPVAGGVVVRGGWGEAWRANLELRGAGRVLARIAEFRALHLAQLDKRARRVSWSNVLRANVPVRVEVTCRHSRIYHSGAAEQRIATAIREELGAPIAADAGVVVKARIEDDLCSIAIDTSGEFLHKRGHKAAVGKAPLRETLAALFLRQCGFDGRTAVVDPLCGSGTFVIEAAEMAAGLAPGRARAFAFEQLATFDAAAWQHVRSRAASSPVVDPGGLEPDAAVRFFGSDRDAGAVAMSRANAERAGVAASTEFRQHAVSDLKPPAGPPGLVITNPPYGTRIGDKAKLQALYAALGSVLKARFGGWRVGVVTSDETLAKASGLPFGQPSAYIPHGGLKVRLYTTGPLP